MAIITETAFVFSSVKFAHVYGLYEKCVQNLLTLNFKVTFWHFGLVHCALIKSLVKYHKVIYTGITGNNMAKLICYQILANTLMLYIFSSFWMFSWRDN